MKRWTMADRKRNSSILARDSPRHTRRPGETKNNTWDIHIWQTTHLTTWWNEKQYMGHTYLTNHTSADLVKQKTIHGTYISDKPHICQPGKNRKYSIIYIWQITRTLTLLDKKINGMHLTNHIPPALPPPPDLVEQIIHGIHRANFTPADLMKLENTPWKMSDKSYPLTW